MTREQTIALWQQCEAARAAALAQGETSEKAHEAAKAIWNGWAQPLLESCESLKASGEFKIAKFDYLAEDWIGPESFGENPATEQWLDAARVDFNGHVFGAKADFREFLFPGQSIFGESKKYTKNRIARPSVVFRQGVEFGGSTFFWDAVFDWCHFERAAGFSNVTFCDVARFDQCLFSGTAWFRHINFKGDVWMGQVKFKGYTDFRASQFGGVVSFYGALSEGAFILDLVQFSEAPDFTQATFQGTPKLDRVQIPDIVFLPDSSIVSNNGLQARYRAIRLLAIQGHDHENEAKAFRSELRLRRGLTDYRYGLGFWYDLIGDCGHSIWRPFLTWVGLTFFLSQFYLWQANTGINKACAGADGRPLQSLYLSLKNALVLFGGTRDARVNQAYICLYGGDSQQPAIPSSVTFMETLVQTPTSAVLIFLLLLAIRNQFKIK